MNKQIAWVMCLIVSFSVSTSPAVASENCTEISTDFQFCQGSESEAMQDRWRVHLMSEIGSDSLANRLATEFGSTENTPLLIAGISNIFLTHAKNFQTGFIYKAESFAEPIDGKELARIAGGWCFSSRG
ncbi:hypothetical protein AAFO92_14625 [Roseovarius sp. CAU 1744]|uniref:hypothetical protein n=1 Tax=Roseovarius sp. CAU 1744 TaxID=3140368 RepID=UPI00325BC4B5